MRTRFALTVAVGLLLAACGGGAGTSTATLPDLPPPQTNAPSSAPVQTSTPAPGSVETSTPAPGSIPTSTPVPGTVVWQAGSLTLGSWINANTYQCGSPVQSGADFFFSLARDGTSCGRNQAMPEAYVGEGNFLLAIGTTYTWTFEYIDGNESGQAPGMGPDTEAQSFIWQIHDAGCGTGGLAFGFTNATGGTQQWGLSNPGPQYLWSGPYTPQERDTWQIVVRLEQSGGSIQLWRNGIEVYSNTDVSTAACAANWWNFGPYKWRWELAAGGGSDMTLVQASINDMTLTTP